MKRSLPITGVAMLLRSFLLYGQAVPPIQVTVGTAARGAPAYFVTNTGTITVTAFALALSLPVPPGGKLASASQVTTYDVALGTAPAPILAGGQIAVGGVSPKNAAFGLPTVQAVVFADGSSWGDGRRVQRIMALRGFTRQRLTGFYNELSTALAQATSREALIAKLQAEVDNRATLATDPDDQAAIVSARMGVLFNLRNDKKPDGTPYPVAQVVQQQMSDLNDRLVAVRTYGGVQ